METLAGFQKTGRVTRGPASDLIELVDEEGFPHTAIAFHAQYRDHPAIGAAFEVVKAFLEAPYVTGMVELVDHVPEEGAFIYPTGESWSVHEVIRKLADMGQTAGVRAGLELLYAAGQVLIEAAESGEAHGVYSHGGLTPWRVLVKADGQVQIIGHAVPQVEILQFHADPEEIPKEDAFRYCPPERMEAQDEDLSSDLFSLSLIAFELMTGRPVYDGLVNDIRTQAARGEGSRRLFRFKEQLPGAALDLMRTCLKPDPEHRHEDGDEFLQAVQKVLAGADAMGPSLMEVMDRIGEMKRPPGEGLEAGKTMALDPESIRKAVAELEGEEAAAPSAVRESFKPSLARRPRRAPRARSPEAEEDLPSAAPIEEAPAPAPEEDDGGGEDRWKKPTRGRRARSARGSNDDQESAGGRSMGRPDRSGADEILEKLKSSSDRQGRRGRSQGRGQTAQRIEDILSSSDDARDSGEAGGESPAESAPEADSEAKPGASRNPRRGRRPVRRRGGAQRADEQPAEETPASANPARGSDRSTPEPEEEEVRSRRPTLEPPEEAQPEPESEPKPEPEPEPEPKPEAVAEAEPKSSPPAPRRRRSSPSGSAPSAPRRLKATGGASITLKLRIAPDGDTFKTRFPKKATLAECVARLTGSILPLQAAGTGEGPSVGRHPGGDAEGGQSLDPPPGPGTGVRCRNPGQGRRCAPSLPSPRLQRPPGSHGGRPPGALVGA